MFSGQRPHTHKRHRHRRHDGFSERTDFFGSPLILAPPPDVDYGAMSLVNGRCRALDLTRVSFVSRLISGQVTFFGYSNGALIVCTSFGNIDQDGAWPTRGCDVKRLFYRLWNLARFVNQVTVLRDRECDSRYVGLLKSVVADEIGGHLTRKRDDGHLSM